MSAEYRRTRGGSFPLRRYRFGAVDGELCPVAEPHGRRYLLPLPGADRRAQEVHRLALCEASRAGERVGLSVGRLELGYRTRGGDLRPACSAVRRLPQLRVEGVPVESVGETQLRDLTRAHRRARDAGELGAAVGRADDRAAGPCTGEAASGPEQPPLVEADRGERARLEVLPVSRPPRAGPSRGRRCRSGAVERPGSKWSARVDPLRRATGAERAQSRQRHQEDDDRDEDDQSGQCAPAASGEHVVFVPRSIALVGSSTCASPAAFCAASLKS